MTDIAVVQLAVEGLLLLEALACVRPNRHAHVAEDRRRLLAARAADAFVDALPCRGGIFRSHPVEEDAVSLGAGERAHLGAHRRHRDASALR
jgi:hypothetical protein